MVEIDRIGVVNDAPVNNDNPPVGSAYQFIVPADAVADNITVPVPQRVAGVVDVIDGITFTVTG